MRQANRDASTKKIARRHINVIHARNRFAEARRRRETASRAEFETFARRFPKIILRAVLTAVSENSPDAFAPLPSPWRERLLAAWKPLPERPTVPVVDLAARRTAAKEATK